MIDYKHPARPVRLNKGDTVNLTTGVVTRATLTDKGSNR